MPERRRCPECDGTGAMFSIDLGHTTLGEWGDVFRVPCLVCQGTGYPADSLNQFHVALDQGLETIIDQIEGMAEAANARLDRMVMMGNRRQHVQRYLFSKKPLSDLIEEFAEAVRQLGTALSVPMPSTYPPRLTQRKESA